MKRNALWCDLNMMKQRQKKKKTRIIIIISPWEFCVEFYSHLSTAVVWRKPAETLLKIFNSYYTNKLEHIMPEFIWREASKVFFSLSL